MATAMVGITDYGLCASFIADNGSDFHVINRFYRDRLTNIRPAQDINIRHGPDVTPVKLIGDAYYNAYDQYGRLIRFNITGVLYMPDFITNIVSMRLAKERANLFFETQFGRVYDANGYIHAITREVCKQWILEYADPSTIDKTALATIRNAALATVQNTDNPKPKPKAH